MKQAIVKVEYGETVNIGDFSNFRLSAGVEFPCDATKAAVDTTFYNLIKECKAQVKKEKTKILEELKAEKT